MAAPALLLCIGLPLCAQTPGTPAPTSNLPATPPTAAAPATQTPPPPAHRAQVVFADGQLTVRADNSSLHQILYSISTLTGMTINGGVEDQRVFGSYGPGDASTILATLLDGTGVNLFIREGDNHQPTELILTPRSGAPGPAITAKDAEIGSNEPVAAGPGVHELAPGDSMPLSPSSGGAQANNSANSGVNPAAAQPAPDASSQAPASNGQLTPDQVYQKILEMQKAHAGATNTNPPASGPPSGAGNPQ